jgi:hypothetical protein
MSRSSTLRQRFHGWLSDDADEAVLRWIFRGVLTVTIVALTADLARMEGWTADPDAAAPPAEIGVDSPALDPAWCRRSSCRNCLMATSA